MKKQLAFNGMEELGLRPEDCHIISSDRNVGNGTRVYIPTAFVVEGKRIVLSLAYGAEMPTGKVAVDDVIESVYQWGLKLQIFPADAQQGAIVGRIKKSQFLDLSVKSLADVTDLEAHILAAELVQILYLFDDIVDREGTPLVLPENRSLLNQFLCDLAQVVEGTKTAAGSHVEKVSTLQLLDEERDNMNRLLTVVEDFGARIRAYNNSLMDPTPFNHSLRDYFRSAIQEMNLSDSASIKSYNKVRDVSGGVLAFKGLVDYLRGLAPVNEIVARRPEYLRGPIKGDRVVCMVNDGVGAKEWRGPEKNFVKLMFRGIKSEAARVGVPLSDCEAFVETMGQLVRKHDSNMEKFYRRWHELKSEIQDPRALFLGGELGDQANIALKRVNQEFDTYLKIMAGNFLLSCGSRYQRDLVDIN